MRLIALSLVAALAACGGKSKPTATPTPDPVVTEPAPTEPVAVTPKATPSDAVLDALFARSLDYFDALGVVIEANKTDCPAMAKALDQTFTTHQALLDEAQSYKGNPEVDAKADAYMEAHKDRLNGAMGKMVPGTQACSKDPDVLKALKRFDEM